MHLSLKTLERVFAIQTFPFNDPELSGRQQAIFNFDTILGRDLKTISQVSGSVNCFVFQNWGLTN
jgi:hypothetical protein